MIAADKQGASKGEVVASTDELKELFKPEKWIFSIPEVAQTRIRGVKIETVPQAAIESLQAKKQKQVNETESMEDRAWDAVTIVGEDGQTRILVSESPSIDREDILEHEGLHVAGAWHNLGGQYEDLEDAVVEILRVSNKVKETEPDKVFSIMKAANIRVSYLTLVGELLLAMHATSNDAEPVDVDRLAEMFFDENLGSLTMIMMEIVRKSADVEKELVGSLVRRFL